MTIRQAALNYTGSGASSIAIHGSGTPTTLTGNVSAGQSITIESVNSEHAVLTTSGAVSNAGTITLTDAETSANQAWLIASGTLTNSGSIKVEPGVGGQRFLQGKFTNTGTIAINATTFNNGNGGVLNNLGALNLANGTQMIVSNEASITNGAGGSVNGTGNGNVQIEPFSSFTEGAGTTTGSKPVIIRDAALHYTGSGASSIAAHGQGTTLSGNLSAGQSLSIESINGEHSYVTAAASFTNAGAIKLTSTETSPNQAALIISAGTLANSGSISVETGVGGARFLEGNVTNTGTITINATTKYDASKALLTNEGALKLAAGQALIVSAGGSVINGTGGNITAGENADVAIEPESTFTEGAGTTSGTRPVIVRDAALVYAGSGSSTIAAHGTGTTISGNISSGQSLSIESVNGEHSYVTAAASFTNAGAIKLTSTETSPNQAALIVTAGTLANSGTISSEPGVGGLRFLQANITNTGTIAINATTKYDTAAATLVNQGAITIASGAQLQASAHPTISNEAGGAITVSGTGVLLQTEGTFNQGLGKTTTAKTSEPVVLDRVALHYTDKGTSKLAQRGAGTLSGTIGKGSTLTIESSCSEHASTTSAGSFLNAGTLNLTNVETCGNNATLNLAGGTLENGGTINVLFPHGGSRSIEGSLVNNKTLAISNDPGQSLKVTGAFTQGTKGTTKMTIAGSSNFSRLVASGAVTIAGKLSLKQLKFTGKAAESFGVIGGATRTGEFASITGNAIKGGGLHYLAHYTATGVNLVVE